MTAGDALCAWGCGYSPCWLRRDCVVTPGRWGCASQRIASRLDGVVSPASVQPG